MVSLALALGLSDLASRDIRIESLFIDEGFGTLDGDTLEDAISTLEQLQSESNKLVGIISHVDSLKERITTQLILERQNNGYSTLKITQ
jgi:exonuclease SbcC